MRTSNDGRTVVAAIDSSDPVNANEEIAGIQENHAIAELLREIADLLAQQSASEFRVRAYRAAAETIAHLHSPIRTVLSHDGIDGLVSLPTIGVSIANLVDTYLRLGHMALLDRLRGESNAEKFFTTLPGVGPELSHRIYEHLHVETLPELYAATTQGRLAKVPGLGRKRIQAIQESLAQRLGKKAGHSTHYSVADRSIPVDELLEVDQEYRRKATDGTLVKISPSKFNPGKVAWLPILHTQRDGRHYTALYSNSARAHELGTTRDWVVVYRDDANSHGRWTIITSQFGKLHGCRIVRGREDECETYYQQQSRFHEPAASHPVASHPVASHPAPTELPAPSYAGKGGRSVQG
ncbi:MAG: helix-hairpin-helix domain-containing protein [Pirellulaceae bacterium]